MVYTTYLWWNWRWFIIVLPTLLNKIYQSHLLYTVLPFKVQINIFTCPFWATYFGPNLGSNVSYIHIYVWLDS